MGKSYFEKYEEWTEFKHKIIEHYLWIWASKVGKSSLENKVFYIDGFAGGGIYKGTYDGSPLIAAKISMKYSDQSKKGKRLIECIFVERDKKLADHLAIALSELGFQHFHIYTGTFGKHIREIVESVKGFPAFIFIDPFGVKAIPFGTLKPLFGLNEKTELMINFNLPGLNRLAGWVRHNVRPDEQGFFPLIQPKSKEMKNSKRTRQSNIKIVSEVLSSESWLRVIGRYEYNSDAFYEELLNIYKGNLGRHFTVVDPYPIRARKGIKGRLKYYLIHCANHPEARRVMHEAVSRESRKAEYSNGQTNIPFKERSDY